MGMVAGIGSLVGAAASAGGTFLNAMGTNAANQFQAQVAEENAQLEKAKAVETNANMVQRLNQSLGNIDAVRAAGHDNPAGPEASVLRGTTTQYANTARTAAVGNILTQSSMDAASASYLQQAGSFALLTGGLSAAGNLASAIGRTNFGSFGFGTNSATNSATNFNPLIPGSLI